MTEFERILLECRYLLSLNKNYDDLSLIFNIDKDIIYNDLNNKLKSIDSNLYNKCQLILKNSNKIQ